MQSHGIPALRRAAAAWLAALALVPAASWADQSPPAYLTVKFTVQGTCTLDAAVADFSSKLLGITDLTNATATDLTQPVKVGFTCSKGLSAKLFHTAGDGHISAGTFKATQKGGTAEVKVMLKDGSGTPVEPSTASNGHGVPVTGRGTSDDVTLNVQLDKDDLIAAPVGIYSVAVPLVLVYDQPK